MTAPDPRPWWASDPNDPTAPADDPVTAHRAARRGPTEDTTWWRPSGDGADDAADAEPIGRHTFDGCGVCPVCAGLRVLYETRPDLAHHLAEAARHVAAAVRTVLEPPGQADADEPLEHIDLDE